MDSLGRHHVTEEQYFLSAHVAFCRVELKPGMSDALQHLFQPIQVIVLVAEEDDNIIQVCQADFP